MNRIEMASCLFAGALGMTALASASTTLPLVEEGEARSVIVLDATDSAYLTLAAEELQWHVQQASGATLPIMTWDEAQGQAEDVVRIHIGPNAWTQEAGVLDDDLAPEHYRVLRLENHLVFLGHDVQANEEGPLHRRNSPATFWAVGHFLDHELDVRWLWPGEVGTHVPRRQTITVGDMNITQGPRGAWREMVSRLGRPGDGEPELLSDEQHEQMRYEAELWKKRHQMAIHKRLPFGHAFNAWWDRYADDHPDYFAQPPADGPEMPWPRANRVKLRQGNPAVVEQIAAEWREGRAVSFWGEPYHQPAPPYWGVAPTDGTGFCTHPSSRAMDKGAAVDAAPHAIWDGQVNLTARYVKFWQQVLERIHAEDPNVVVCTYAYGPYSQPPTCDVDFGGKLAIGFATNYWDESIWRGWQQTGAKLFLRPNWWHTGAAAPHLPLRTQAEYVRTYHNEVSDPVGYHYDEIRGYWGTQGPLYYASARLAVRPDLTVDEVIQEYLETFGDAAPAVQAYLDYWEQFETEAGMGVIEHPAGWEAPYEDSRFEQLAKQHNILLRPIPAGFLIMPYLFTDSVIDPADRLLAQAADLAGADAMAQERVRFLQDGLHHTRLMRDVIKHAYGEAYDRAKHAELAEQLKELRRELSPRHVVWGEQSYIFEWQRRIATDRWHQRWADR